MVCTWTAFGNWTVEALVALLSDNREGLVQVVVNAKGGVEAPSLAALTAAVAEAGGSTQASRDAVWKVGMLMLAKTQNLCVASLHSTRPGC